MKERASGEVLCRHRVQDGRKLQQETSKTEGRASSLSGGQGVGPASRARLLGLPSLSS